MPATVPDGRTPGKPYAGHACARARRTYRLPLLTIERDLSDMTPARIITVTALCMASVATGAQAKGGPRRHHGHVAPDLRHVPKLTAIPPALLAAFPIFGQPAAAKVPDVVLRSVQGRLFVKRYGTDPRQARAITG